MGSLRDACQLGQRALLGLGIESAQADVLTTKHTDQGYAFFFFFYSILLTYYVRH